MSDKLFRSLIVSPLDSDFHRRPTPAGFGAPKEFGGPGSGEAARQAMLDSCTTLQSQISQQQKSTGFGIGIAQVALRDDALAKSHQPIETFTTDTCLVIGDGDDQGSFRVIVSSDRLARLGQRLQETESKAAKAHLTSVKSFTLMSPQDRLDPHVLAALQRQLTRTGHGRITISIPRFELFTPLYQSDLEVRLEADRLRATLQSIQGVHNVPYLELGNFLIYGAELTNIEQAYQLAALPFVERITVMKTYQAVQVDVPEVVNTLGAPITIGPLPEDALAVAVADTGIDPESPINQLVIARHTFISDEETDTTHGTQVAALVAAQGSITSGILSPRCPVVDIRILKKDEIIQEEDLVPRLQGAFSLYAHKAPIWVLALASPPGPQHADVSYMGQFLDRMRQEHDVLIVCAAGNRQQLRRVWPPDATDAANDWISSPGDTVRNLAVTSVAPDEAPPDALVQPGEPSPFVGHGPGPAGLYTPHLAAYGGNGRQNGALIGIPTVGRDGRLIEMPGTSSAAPQVAGALSELARCFRGSIPSHSVGLGDPLLLAKAAILHHAQLPALLRASDTNLADWYGFGIPGSLEQMIGDPIWRSTTFIVATLRPNGDDFVINDFPFPDGLRSGGFCRGQILVTLVAEPLLRSGSGIEYVRSEVDVAFGPVRIDENSQEDFDNLLQAKNAHPKYRYEDERVRLEHKWSPLKRYQRRLRHGREDGIVADMWRFKAQLLLRADESAALNSAKRFPRRFMERVEEYSVNCVFAVTITDPRCEVEVSHQMVRQWRTRGNVTTQIEIASRIRSQFSAISQPLADGLAGDLDPRM